MRILPLIIFISVFFFNTTTSMAVANNIDAELESCMSKASSTQDMNNCLDIAQKAWEKETDKTIFSLKSKLNKESYKKLKKSQELWEEYKISEFQTIDNLIEQKHGTIYLNLQKGFKVDITKQRTLLLKQYLNTIDEN